MHFIHARRGWERSSAREVVADVDERTGEVILRIPREGATTWREHGPERLAEVLRRSGGHAVWRPEYHLLCLPSGRRGLFLFNLARPEEWVPCLPPQEPADADFPALQTAPGVFRPPRADEDAAGWARAVAEALDRDWNRGESARPQTPRSGEGDLA